MFNFLDLMDSPSYTLKKWPLSLLMMVSFLKMPIIVTLKYEGAWCCGRFPVNRAYPIVRCFVKSTSLAF